MKNMVALLALVLALFPVSVRADALSAGNQCQDAITADDWGSASVYCQDAYEAMMSLSRTSSGSTRYQARDLADIDLGAAGYANLHFDPDTGRDQLARAQADLQALLADAQCPASEKDYVTGHALPLVNTWARYQPDSP